LAPDLKHVLPKTSWDGDDDPQGLWLPETTDLVDRDKPPTRIVGILNTEVP